ncbi:site-specific integrase [Herbaspirillum huttiense]|uniref:site-specific integrase n=1 Tax=Herbaspirillum huttiense TaxID=863372 RepID=UPI00308464E7
MVLRPSGYYFRFTIPKHWRQLLGRSEIRRSLRTHDRREALLLAATMSANVLQKLKTLKEDMGKLPSIDFDNIRSFEIESLEIGGAKLKGINVDSNNPLDVEAFNKVLATLREQYRAEAEAEAAQSSPQPPATPPQPTASADKNLLSQIFPIYLRHRDKAGISGHSLDDFTSAYNLLIDVIGDKPITHFSQDDANHFVDIVQQLPPNRNKVKAYRGKSIDEIIQIRKEMEEAENHKRRQNPDAPLIPADLSMSPRTVDKHIGILGTFFKWAIGKGYVHGKNYFEGQKIQTKAERDADTEGARLPFSNEDLRKIFAPENYSTRKNSHEFWFPLIGLFTGMRLNEIAQLYLTDIIEVNGIWAFDINKNRPDKRLKNATSKRLVPVHPQLLELGFLDFVEDVKKTGKDRLFPHLSYVENSYGRLPGRNFAEYLTSIGITEKEKVFHSFRHTFNDNLKQIALLGEEARSELTGHAHHGINSLVYSSTHRMLNKFEFIKGLRFEGVLFGHLKYQTGQFFENPFETAKKKVASPQRIAAKQAREERYRLAGKPMPK